MTRKKSKTPPDPRARVAHLVDQQFKAWQTKHAARIQDVNSYDRSDKRLIAALRRETPPHCTDHIDAIDVMEQELRAALGTDALRAKLFEYTEGIDQEARLRHEAAFLFGMEVGRRLTEVCDERGTTRTNLLGRVGAPR